MITIIWGPIRSGKTALMTHLLNELAFDYERISAMRREIEEKNIAGFTLSIPEHPVFSNYEIKFFKFGRSRMQSYYINPYRVGYWNKDVKTFFLPPYHVRGITEGQKYFNSRMAMYNPDWLFRELEQSGHNYIDVFIDVQRPLLIDPNIRELSRFIEIRNLEIKYKHGEIVGLVWTIRECENSELLDKYLASGRLDKSCYEEKTIKADYNVFKLYNSRNCKPKHYAGRLDRNFTLIKSEPVENSPEGYKHYLEKYDDELPENFYIKRSERDGRKETDRKRTARKT